MSVKKASNQLCQTVCHQNSCKNSKNSEEFREFLRQLCKTPTPALDLSPNQIHHVDLIWKARKSHISMIESGAKQPNFETIWRIACAFDLAPHELVERIEREDFLP